MQNFDFVLMRGTTKIHLSAIADFFNRNPSMTPENVALELENLKDALILSVQDESKGKDVRESYRLLKELIDTFREM